MWLFHVRHFARNGFFVQLLVTTTIGMVALQALAGRAPGAGNELGWLRAGLVGTWTECTVAAGMLGYQRFQGTLVYLMRSALPSPRVLFPVVGAASVFGLAAFPLSIGSSLVLSQPVQVSSWMHLVMAVGVFWVACLSVSLVIGMLFVLTPNAMTYEGLLAIPILLASGIFGTPAGTPAWLVHAMRVLPLRSAVEAFSAPGAAARTSGSLVGESLAISVVWIAIAWACSQLVARRAIAHGSLELV